ncbi:MAG: flagellar motor protein MotA [Rhodospirillales bacterium RIFCSPLOWO2_12_FULL_58_28]|nr:MAG: flagellar motor protein MotA [Rhodospirillales bacterium RIFCSPLOWO2_02_FULL_58_16]OHC78564.1 MAG: flagellar motor protein MotA [Rhodospirillales bacterium RIFCSPLOWO2_12_FULL_58_28]
MALPRRFLVRMIIFFMIVVTVCGVLYMPLKGAFMSNAPLNGLILGVLLLGVFYNFRQVTMLYPEAAWINNFRNPQTGLSHHKPPKLLASMANMMGGRKDKLKLSAMSMRSLLDGIYFRLDESRDLSRYNIGLLIFLGLLGTFWGLLETISSIGNVISGLSAGGDVVDMFGKLQDGLKMPLHGMGTAFSTSLFGLSGSLILGFLDLQAGQAQNRFYNDLEEWLSSLTRLSGGSLSGDGDQSVPAYVQALLEQMADGLENLQRTLIKGEENRVSAEHRMMELGEKVGTLTDHMRTEQSLMMKMAETQVETKNVLVKLFDGRGTARADGLDEATRTHIRNLDVYMARLLEEMNSGRNEIIQSLRSEIKLLARTIAGVSESASPGNSDR